MLQDQRRRSLQLLEGRRMSMVEMMASDKDLNFNKIRKDEYETMFTPVPENPQILPKILQYLPFDSILSSRQVSKLWNSVICSNQVLGKRCFITIYHSVDTALALFVNTASKATTDRQKTKNHLPTFSNFRFVTENLTNSTSTQMQFWEQVGTNIRSLELLQHSLGPVTFLEVLLACPNLEELTFCCAPIYSNNNQQQVGSLRVKHERKHLQRLIPNLKFIQKPSLLDSLVFLNIKDSNNMPSEVLIDLLQWCGRSITSLSLMDDNPNNSSSFQVPLSRTRAVAAASMRLPLPQIPAWDIHHVLDFVEKQARILNQLALTGLHILPAHIHALAKLKQLELRILKLTNVRVDTTSMIALFRRQKYLEEIDLSFTGISEKAFLHPSCTFYKLKKLSLAGYTSNIDYFSFLSKMTNLIELNLSSSRSNSMTWDSLIHSFLPIKLKKLTTLDLSCNVKLGSLRKQALFQTFLRNLKFSLTCLYLSCNGAIRNGLLQIIWKELGKLRILFLEQMPNVTDEGFTGIRQRQLSGNEQNNLNFNASLLRQQNNGTSHIGMCKSKDRLLGTLKDDGSDSDYKKIVNFLKIGLETLSIASNAKLTDLAVQFGIRFLPNLKKLKMPGCSKITDRSLFYLIGTCKKLEYIDLRGCNQVTITWVQWASKTSPTLKTILGPHLYVRPLTVLGDDQQQQIIAPSTPEIVSSLSETDEDTNTINPNVLEAKKWLAEVADDEYETQSPSRSPITSSGKVPAAQTQSKKLHGSTMDRDKSKLKEQQRRKRRERFLHNSATLIKHIDFTSNDGVSKSQSGSLSPSTSKCKLPTSSRLHELARLRRKRPYRRLRPGSLLKNSTPTNNNTIQDESDPSSNINVSNSNRPRGKPNLTRTSVVDENNNIVDMPKYSRSRLQN